jgi:hypothetical protein
MSIPAAILFDGTIVITDKFTQLGYHPEGYLLSFIADGKLFRFFHAKDHTPFNGYYLYDQYLEYYAKEEFAYLQTFNFSEYYVQDIKDVIVHVYRRIFSPSTSPALTYGTVCWERKNFPYDKKWHSITFPKAKVFNAEQTSQLYNFENSLASFLPILLPSNAQTELPINCNHSDVGDTFFMNYRTKATSYAFASQLCEIQMYLEDLAEKLDAIADPSGQLGTFKVDQKNHWKALATFNYDTIDDYKKLRQRLTKYNLVLDLYEKMYQGDLIMALIYIMHSTDAEAIMFLPASIKMRMLVRLTEGDLDNWQFGVDKAEDAQSVVVKIVMSITKAQANKFLDDIIDKKQYLVLLCDCGNAEHNKLYSSLFIALWNRLTNSTAGFGSDFRDQYVFALYEIWKTSTYNPYREGEGFDPLALNHFTYNTQSGSHPDPSSGVSLEGIGVDGNKFNFAASPLIVDYQSDKQSGFYVDNMDFYFSEASTSVPGKHKFDSHFPTGTSATNITRVNYPTDGKLKIFVVMDDYRNGHSPGLYGTYDVYQPLQLVDSNQETVIKMPVLQGGTDPQVSNLNSLIPAFLLKHIDDKGDKSDFYTAVGYAVDIASLAFGGYGLIFKLKHLRALSGISEAMLLGTETFNTVHLTAKLSAFLDGISLGASSVNLFMRLALDQYSEEPWHKKMVNTLMWLEIVSSCGSFYSEMKLKKNAKILLDEFNTNGVPQAIIDEDAGGIFMSSLQAMSGGVLTSYQQAIIVKQKLKERVYQRMLSNNQRYHIESKFELDDTPIGQAVTKPPRFSRFVYTSNVSGRYTYYTRTSNIRHADAQLVAMIDEGLRLHLPPKVIEDIILKSFRTQKSVGFVDVNLWMNNYHEFLHIRGKVPFAFKALPGKYPTAAAHYQAFILEVKNKLWDKYNLQLFGADLTLSGSCMTKKLPPDMDLAMYASKDGIVKYCQNQIEFFKKVQREYQAAEAIGKTEAELKLILMKPNEVKKRIERFEACAQKGRIRGSDICTLKDGKIHNIKDEMRRLDNEVLDNLNISEKKFDFNVFDSTTPDIDLQPSITIFSKFHY